MTLPFPGYGPNGIEDLKKQSFFATINWEKLLLRQVSPPFKPTSNRAGDDTFYFDKQFTVKTPRGKNTCSTSLGGLGSVVD